MSNKIELSINKKFVAGFLTYNALLSLQQDYWGKDETIRHITNNWVTAWVSIPISLICLGLAFWLCLGDE